MTLIKVQFEESEGYSVYTLGETLIDFLKPFCRIVCNSLPKTFGLLVLLKLQFILNRLIIPLSEINFLEEAEDPLNWGAEVAAWCSVNHWNSTLS
jgi:hypothetical protein